MRKVSLAFRVIAFLGIISVSAVGQQPRSAFNVVGTESTLADAARANNFPLFEALYSQGGYEATRFAELRNFWTWSMTDPVGGFYGESTHARFAREYPDYAEYIADYGIVDANGRAFYPSAETRTFLLRHAIKGDAPIVRVAETVKPKAVSAHHARVATRFSASKPRHGVLKHAAPQIQPVAVAKVAPAPSPVRVTVTQPVPAPLPAAPQSDDRLARGFMLIIAGLLAAGMLTLMVRTPKETA